MKIISAATLAKQAKASAAEDLAQRRQATTILTPEALQGKGKPATAAVKRLMTTLGGKIRPITRDDLQTFQRAVQKLQSERQHVGGILPGEVIAGSLPEDRARSKAEITFCVPFRYQSGVVSFQTSASGKHGATRHIVNVELTGWARAVGSPSTPAAAAKIASEQPIRFECSCSRHRYWYRYIATIGGWNLGRVETGLPKIRNPLLAGIACKHALRVMTELSGAGVRGQLARAITQERKRLEGKTKKTVHTVERRHAQKITTAQAAKPKDIERMVAKLRTALEGKKPRKPLPVDQKGLERLAAVTHGQMLSLKMPRAQADAIAAAILAGGVQP